MLVISRPYGNLELRGFVLGRQSTSEAMRRMLAALFISEKTARGSIDHESQATPAFSRRAK